MTADTTATFAPSTETTDATPADESAESGAPMSLARLRAIRTSVARAPYGTPASRALVDLLAELDRVNVANGQLAAELSHYRGTDPSPLSPAEVPIVAGIAHGETAHDTAARVGLSFHTVRSHRMNIFGRTGAINGAHLVYLAMTGGWLPELVTGTEARAPKPAAKTGHLERAAKLRSRPGTWQTVAEYSRDDTARALVYRIRNGIAPAYRPAGDYEARTHLDGDRTRVDARYLPDPESGAAS